MEDNEAVLQKLQQGLLEQKRILLYHEVKCEEALAEILHYETEIENLANKSKDEAVAVLDKLVSQAYENMKDRFREQPIGISNVYVYGNSDWYYLKDGWAVYATYRNFEKVEFNLVGSDKRLSRHSYTYDETLDLIIDRC